MVSLVISGSKEKVIVALFCYFSVKHFMFMKIIFLLLFSTFLATAFAQKGLEGMIRAENNFAAYSVKHGTKEAFLRNMDSSSIVFEKGNAVNGLSTWQKKENRPGILNWHPEYVEIASSQNFGYSTGPWTFQPASIQDSIVARGYFITVWQAGEQGKWTFLTDIGVSNTLNVPAQPIRRISHSGTGTGSLNSMVETEKAFIAASKVQPLDAYRKYLSATSLLHRNGQLPATRPEDQEQRISSTPGLQYDPIGWKLSPSGDLGFVYGNILDNGKTENYLRIWRREKDGWKLALEVLRY
jgi:hypothetical protein